MWIGGVFTVAGPTPFCGWSVIRVTISADGNCGSRMSVRDRVLADVAKFGIRARINVIRRPSDSSSAQFWGRISVKPRFLADTFMQAIAFKAGDTIISEGDEGDTAFFIVSGSVDVIIGRGATAKIVGTLQAGEVFGEMCRSSQVRDPQQS